MRKSAFVLIALLVGVQLAFGQATLSQSPSSVHYQNGLDLISHHEYGAAYNAFDKFLSLRSPNDPRTLEAQYLRAYCAITLLHADGEKLLGQFISANPVHPRAIFANYELARFFYDEKNYAKAAGYFSKVNFSSLGDEQQNVDTAFSVSATS
jgi:TolA-binding protein